MELLLHFMISERNLRWWFDKLKKISNVELISSVEEHKFCTDLQPQRTNIFELDSLGHKIRISSPAVRLMPHLRRQLLPLTSH